MLAAIALLGLGAVGLSKKNGDDTQAMQELATQEQTSDDPMLYHYGQVGPNIYRGTGTSNVHWEHPREHVVFQDLKSRQGERLDNVLRDPRDMTQEEIDGARFKRWDCVNPDIPFVGHNGSSRNHHLNWARTLPRDPAPDTVWGTGAPMTLAETCGDEQQNDIQGPAYFDVRYVHQHGFFSGNTGRVMVDHHMPAFCHWGPQK